jgi:hypothetical protein
MLDLFAISDFEARLNTTFQMYINETTSLEVELVDVKKHGNTESPYQFSLKFAAPPGAPINQGIYKMLHESLGEQHLFLVPTARDAEHLYYEAVFNNPQ